MASGKVTYTDRAVMKPHRVPLYDFPDVVLHAPESVVKGHPEYHPAKVGDAVAAERIGCGATCRVAS